MPVPVQTGRQIGPLRRAFGLFGGLRLKLDETVVPVAVIEDLVQEEWRDAFAGDVRGLGGALNTHKWMLRNPAGSGILSECYEVGMNCSSVGVEWQILVEDPPFIPGTVLASSFQDLSGEFNTPQQFPACDFQTAATAAVPVGTIAFTTVTNTTISWIYRPRIVLHPGQSFILWENSANQNANVWFQWRERPLLPGE